MGGVWWCFLALLTLQVLDMLCEYSNLQLHDWRMTPQVLRPFLQVCLSHQGVHITPAESLKGNSAEAKGRANGSPEVVDLKLKFLHCFTNCVQSKHIYIYTHVCTCICLHAHISLEE